MRLDWPQPYTDLDHTADVGISVQGSTKEEALARLVLALCSLLADEGFRPAAERREALLVVNGGPDLAGSTVALLREVLRHSLKFHEVPVSCEVLGVDEREVRACVVFTPCDEAHLREVKAVTRHLAKLSAEEGSWKARAVFDV